jgi:hypothetical protein
VITNCGNSRWNEAAMDSFASKRAGSTSPCRRLHPASRASGHCHDVNEN